MKNMDLTKDGLPTKFSKGNSSLILLDANGKSLYLCIFNAACYKQFQQQAVQMGNKADKADGKSSTLFYMKDDAPTITFMQLEKPMPYCIIITE